MEVTGVSKAMSYPSIPDKVIGVLGEQATKQLYDDMREMVSQTAATKVDRTQYDAHSALISEK
jgi:hypothetical protein